MDVSLKYFYFNLLRNDKILECQPRHWGILGGQRRVIPPPHPPSITQRWPTSSRITPHYPTHYPGLLRLISAIQVHYITEDGRRVSWVRFSLIANYSLKWKVPEVAVFTKCHTIDKSNIMLWLVPTYFLFLSYFNNTCTIFSHWNTETERKDEALEAPDKGCSWSQDHSL